MLGCSKERVLTKFLGREMLPHCHGSQIRGKGKIKGVKKKWLPWQPRNMSRLLVTMYYHGFKNLREMFQGHLNRVLMKNVESEDYRDRPCNCPGRRCRYGNARHKALIVYKVTVPRTGKYYIGATLQMLKKWVAGHLQSARQFLRNGTRSSTLAIHLARMWQEAAIQSPVLACYVMSYLAKFFGRVIPSTVQKRLVNFFVSCVSRSELRCSGIHGWMS
jgi:hypothetical protein